MPLPRLFLRFLSSISSSSSRNRNRNRFRPLKSTASTLRSLHDEDDPDRITALLSAAFDPGLVRAAHPVLASALRRLAASGHSASVSNFLETQKRSSPHIVRESFASGVIALYGKARMAGRASDTFAQLPFVGCPRTAMSFRALLCALVDADDADSAANSLRAVSSEYPEIVPGVVCYNVVIHGFLVKGEVEKAMEVLELMTKRGLEPNLVTNNTLLNGFYQNDRFDLAENVWTTMGPHKNIMSYNARLRGLVREGKTPAAVELFREIESNEELNPDGYSFTALIMGHCKDGNLKEAKKVFEEMKRKRCHPNWLTFEALVPSLCEAGELDMAFMLCGECLVRNLRLAEEVMQGLVDALAENSRMEDAKKLVELGWSTSYNEKTLRMPLNCQ